MLKKRKHDFSAFLYCRESTVFILSTIIPRAHDMGAGIVLRPILAYDHRARLAYVRDLRPTPRAQFLLTTSTMCRTNDVGLIYTDTIYRVVMMHASRARYIVLSKNRTVDINWIHVAFLFALTKRFCLVVCGHDWAKVMYLFRLRDGLKNFTWPWSRLEIGDEIIFARLFVPSLSP